MNTEVLRSEAAHYHMLQEQLKAEYAGLDDETLADTLEGLSDLPEMIAEVVRSSLDDEAMIAGLKLRAEALATRLTRLKERHQKKRQLASWTMGAAGLGKLKACDFSVSLCEGALRLEIADESKLPALYLVPQPAKPDRTAISAALKRGEALEGAVLIQGQPYITVSSR
jgi:hypothetical protein